jgi:hypothetical protein
VRPWRAVFVFSFVFKEVAMLNKGVVQSAMAGLAAGALVGALGFSLAVLPIELSGGALLGLAVYTALTTGSYVYRWWGWKPCGHPMQGHNRVRMQVWFASPAPLQEPLIREFLYGAAAYLAANPQQTPANSLELMLKLQGLQPAPETVASVAEATRPNQAVAAVAAAAPPASPSAKPENCVACGKPATTTVAMESDGIQFPPMPYCDACAAMIGNGDAWPPRSPASESVREIPASQSDLAAV